MLLIKVQPVVSDTISGRRGGSGQVVTSQATSAPSQLKSHSVWVVIVQAPVAALQQAPVGCGHGLGVQVVPAPCQVLAEVQLACVVTVQVPAGAQHAPVATHGFGAQVVFAPIHVPVQADCVVTVHVPAGAQQDPVGGPGLEVVACAGFDNSDQFGTASAVFKAK